MESHDLVSLVEKGQALADVEVIEVSTEILAKESLTEEFVDVPKGTEIRRVKDLITPRGSNGSARISTL